MDIDVEIAMLLSNTGMSYSEIMSLSTSRRRTILYFVNKEKSYFYEFFKKLLGAK
jgi:hypothetical protein